MLETRSAPSLASAANFGHGMKICKPYKFDGKNARWWLSSLDNVFESQTTNPTDTEKLKKLNYAVFFMKEEALGW